MNNKFDELTKSMAQSVTRRGALKKFSLGLAGIALASLGLANDAHAHKHYHCRCSELNLGCDRYPAGSYSDCIDYCSFSNDKGACGGGARINDSVNTN